MKASKYLNICQGILAWRWDKHWDFPPNLAQALWLLQFSMGNSWFLWTNDFKIVLGQWKTHLSLVLCWCSQRNAPFSQALVYWNYWQWFAWGFAALGRGRSCWQRLCAAGMWSWGGGAAPLACSELQSKALVPQDVEVQPPQLGISGFKWISGSKARLGRAWHSLAEWKCPCPVELGHLQTLPYQAVLSFSDPVSIGRWAKAFVVPVKYLMNP